MGWARAAIARSYHSPLVVITTETWSPGQAIRAVRASWRSRRELTDRSASAGKQPKGQARLV
ncbi:MAG: hypothetical protein ACFCVB_17805 [Nodosilinea sp.]